ncbi:MULTISPECIES: Ig-like domain-containing protein [unclassified Bacillus (in: firmicutes)]|uniref:Ig-like domain-containing protein n=1 Tax=unclassified Bacillus (in: firmicutes) TaxID=185979 RepID=UPI0008E6A9CD|nr:MULTISPECIES: Ig-like domain-containing protein [unclassified Bacillus (in: firmicutes)]SFB19686.1 Ig-like domain (group 3) [Bacillus sp. UNCCL13]SFQ90720.1 Ig-like domain (group 3) [Bacillus sp. cl95]
MNKTVLSVTKKRKRLAKRIISILCIFCISILYVVPYSAFASGIDNEELREAANIDVHFKDKWQDYQELLGLEVTQDTWNVRLYSDAELLTWTGLKELPFGSVAYKAWFGESDKEIIKEAVVEGATEGVEKGLGLGVFKDAFKGVQTIEDLNKAEERLDTIESTISTAKEINAYLETDEPKSLTAMKILTFGFLSNDRELDITDWNFISLPYIANYKFYSNAFQKGSVIRVDDSLTVVNGAELRSFDDISTPEISTNNSEEEGEETEERIRKLVYSIYQELDGKEAPYYTSYTESLIEAYDEELADFQADMDALSDTVEIMRGEVEKEAKENVFGTDEAVLDGQESETVNIQDKVIEQKIREKISKPTGDITYNDLKKIVELDLSNLNISDIEVLKYMVNLKELKLDNNFIIDISPLQSLKRLVFLSMNNNPLNDASLDLLQRMFKNGVDIISNKLEFTSEPNNTLSEAKLLNVNESILGSLGYEDVDYFKVNVTQEGLLKLNFVADDNIWWPRANIVNSAGESLGSSLNVMPGVYYIEVKKQEKIGKYSLTPQFIPFEHNDTEENDRLDQAEEIGINTAKYGYLGSYFSDKNDYDNMDYFKIKVNEEGFLDLKLSSHDLWNTKVDIVNEKGESFGSSEQIMPGTYYIQVERYRYYQGIGAYTLYPKFTAFSSNDVENNDSIEQAETLTLNENKYGHLGSYDKGDYDTIDYFKINISEEGLLNLKFEYLGWFYANAYIVNSDGKSFGESQQLMPGTYYIQVKRSVGCGSYTLNPEFTTDDKKDAEPNDSLDQAENVDLNTTAYGYLGSYDSFGDRIDTHDYFKIQVTQEGDFSLNFNKDSSLFGYGYLINSTGETIGIQGDPKTLKPGTYYIDLYGWYGYGKYALETKFVPSEIVFTVNPITDQSLEVTGKAEAETIVTIQAGDKVYSALADAKGYFMVPIDLQVAGTKLTISATNNNGSEVKELIVADVTAPEAPQVEEITETSEEVRGSTEGGAEITFEIGSDHYKGVADEKGDFIVPIPLQKAGTQIVVTSTDKAGNTSEATTTVVIDKTAPLKPIVNEVSDIDTIVTGDAEAGSTVTVEVGDEKYSGLAEDGTFSIEIPQQRADTQLTVYVTDASNNVSVPQIITVLDKRSPIVTGVATNGIYNKDVTVSFNEGKATLNGDPFESETIVSAEGVYSLVVTDEAGNSVTVKFTIDKVSPIVTGIENDGVYNKDVTVSFNEGKATLNGDPFESGIVLSAEGVYFLVVTDEAGNKTTVKFTIDKTAPKVSGIVNNAYYNKDVKVIFDEGTATLNEKTLVSGTVVKTAGVYILVVTDAAGNKTTVKFTIDKSPLAAPKVDRIDNNDNLLTGTAEPGSTIEVSSNWELITTGSAGPDGRFSIRLPNAYPVGLILDVTATDQAGNTSAVTKVVVSSVLNGWVVDGGKTYHYTNGIINKGWYKETGKWFFLDKQTGEKKTGWVKDGVKWYYLDANGVMQTGWEKVNNKWYYLDGNGVMKTGWLNVGTSWYYLDSSGVMKTGWLKLGTKWYFFYSNGQMAVNTTVNGYRFDRNGVWIK